MRSSRESRPTCMPGLYLLMYIERVPKDSTSLVKAVSMPLIIEAMSITVTTPMITPMTVRNERSLFARSVPRAIQRFSKMSERKSFISSLQPCDYHSCRDEHCKLKIEKCKFQIYESLSVKSSRLRRNLQFSFFNFQFAISSSRLGSQRFNRIQPRGFPRRHDS